MEAPRWMATALLVCLFVLAGSAVAPSAAQAARRGCAKASLYDRSCFLVFRQGASKRSSARLRTAPARLGWPRRSRPKLFGGNEAAVTQLSPALSVRAPHASTLDREAFDRCPRLGERRQGSGQPCAVDRGLPEALLRAPDASTEKVLRQIGIPIIPDVPPITILRPGGDERDRIRRSAPSP